MTIQHNIAHTAQIGDFFIQLAAVASEKYTRLLLERTS
jgi:hypothetical protein